MQTLRSTSVTVKAAAERFGVSERWIYYLKKKYSLDGDAGLVAKSTRPHSNRRSISPAIRRQICTLRRGLAAQGLDAGAATITWHLQQAGTTAPAISTIWRILRQEGLVTPEPKKRPRVYTTRFAALQPNETWQSDFTHWRLGDGTDVEIINWLDDHSRLLLHCSVHRAVSGKIVVDSFNQARSEYGTPFSTLTDNGNVYTARFTGGANKFEYLLAALGVHQKNGSPGHPQTQGKVERFHQTLKKWLNLQPPATSLEQLQSQLDEFRDLYNNKRGHRAVAMKTPSHCYEATVKAGVQNKPQGGFYRIRYDIVDRFGELSLRRAGQLHHLGVGIKHREKLIIMIIAYENVIVADKRTGEVLSEHAIDDDKKYWTNTALTDEERATRVKKN
ncbi:MAG: transposase [Actinobacteria bacterium]|nr:transposase [Actinomycetota bacterium]